MGGCVSVPSTGGGLGDKTKEIVKETHGALWPFYIAGFLCILGGAAMLIIFKDFRLLAIGIGIALLPPLFIMFLAPIAIYVGWLAVAVAVMGAAYVGYRLYLRAKEKTHEAECSEHEND